MRIRTMIGLVLAAALAVAVIGSPAISAVDEMTSDAQTALRMFTRALAIVESKYVEEINVKDLVYGAINGMLASLDPHSAFLTPENFEELNIDTTGEFGGLGIEISLKDGYIGVITPIDDTPAARAGIKAGDVIFKIDGEITKDLGLVEAVKMMRGRPGTSVVLTIVREGVADPFEITVVRDIIRVPTVKSKVLEPGYGYVKLTQFNNKAANEVVAAYRELDRQEGGLLGLVLDLRNNPGGLLDQAVAVSDEFLDAGLVVSIKGRVAGQNMSVSAEPGGIDVSGPLVVLVNNGSASASEIVAGALQDHHRCVIVGTTTFGKGSVQTILPMEGGAALKLTTAKYYTPSGRDIQAKGIIPDVEVAAEDPRATVEPARLKFFEKDLKNHLKNESEADGAEPDGEETSTDAPPDVGVEIEEPEEPIVDTQLEKALAVLRDWPSYLAAAGEHP
ncbi:MAG: S41 family peptidase [Deltaproteobacteria bacterium]|nr:S41 family peptidase [Deltaproteobacteria bacterium]